MKRLVGLILGFLLLVSTSGGTYFNYITYEIWFYLFCLKWIH